MFRVRFTETSAERAAAAAARSSAPLALLSITPHSYRINHKFLLYARSAAAAPRKRGEAIYQEGIGATEPLVTAVNALIYTDVFML